MQHTISTLLLFVSLSPASPFDIVDVSESTGRRETLLSSTEASGLMLGMGMMKVRQSHNFCKNG